MKLDFILPVMIIFTAGFTGCFDEYTPPSSYRFTFYLSLEPDNSANYSVIVPALNYSDFDNKNIEKSYLDNLTIVGIGKYSLVNTSYGNGINISGAGGIRLETTKEVKYEALFDMMADDKNYNYFYLSASDENMTVVFSQSARYDFDGQHYDHRFYGTLAPGWQTLVKYSSGVVD